MVELLGGEGFDVIIEHLANINLGHDVQMLKNGARIMVVGCRGSVNINPRHLMLPEASIQGVALNNSTPAEYKQMGRGETKFLSPNAKMRLEFWYSTFFGTLLCISRTFDGPFQLKKVRESQNEQIYTRKCPIDCMH